MCAVRPVPSSLPCYNSPSSMLLPGTSLLGAWVQPPEPVDLNEFFPDHSSGYYAFPVDPDSTMCLEVFAGMGGPAAHCQSQPRVPPTGHRRYSTPASSPSAFDNCGARSPHAFSESGKAVKPQYTAELDVLCRICGDRASGFHYGVHSCEGCKGFFRRTLKKLLVYKPCQMGKRCKIDAGTRNKCQHCRYQRCLNAGMSQDAVRFGRMPKIEREKLMADKEELSGSNTKRIVELRSLTDLIKAAFRDVFQGTILLAPITSSSRPCPSSVPTVSSLAGGRVGSTGDHGGSYRSDYLPNNTMSSSSCCSSSSSSSLSSSSLNNTQIPEMGDILHSLSTQEFHDHEIFWRYQEALVPVMESSVKFAKRLPGFASFPMADQIELMKQNGFMVVQLALPAMVGNDLINLDTSISNLRILRHSLCLCQQLQKLLQRPLAVVDRLRNMNLTHGELALFAAVLLTSERPGLISPKPVEDLQADLIEALRLDLKHNHPKDRLLLPKLLLLIPDLLQIVEEFCENLKSRVFDPTADFSKTKPLLREIFDLTC